jgi:hypothetical protein
MGRGYILRLTVWNWGSHETLLINDIGIGIVGFVTSRNTILLLRAHNLLLYYIIIIMSCMLKS